MEAQLDYIISSYRGFTSSAIANNGLDIDESALLLQNMHEKVIELARFLHAYINFDKAFEVEEEGIIYLDRQKEKGNI